MTKSAENVSKQQKFRILKINFVIIILFFLLFGKAEADQQQFQYHPWTFLSGQTGRGTPFCSMATAAVTGKSVSAQNVVIKALQGHERLNVTMVKESWHIPQGTDVEVFFSFGPQDHITLIGYGDGPIVDVEIPVSSTALFLLALDAHSMTIMFPKGRESPWTIPPEGAHPALLLLTQCIQSQRKGTSTQPFGGR